VTKRAVWTLPQVVDPAEAVCYTINVPKERFHIAAFMGAMFQLVKPYNWQDDEAHTAIEVGAVWGKIFDQILAGNCTVCPPPDNGGDGLGGCGCMCCLRWDNGVLQMLACGVWTDVPGLPGGINPPSQPGGGTIPPTPGECAAYTAKIDAGRSWLLPALVNTGDVLHLSSLSGASTGDNPLRWNCPDGKLFLAGACQAVYATHSTDPMPLLPTGQLIWNLNGTYYDALTDLTIPGSVTDQQITLELNYDLSLGHLSGQVSAEVQFCNNGSGIWSHTFNFETGTQGWTTYDTGFGNFFGDWTPGLGFVGTDGVNSGANAHGVAIRIPFPARDLTQFSVDSFDYTKGTVDNPALVAWALETSSAAWSYTHFSATTDGTGLTVGIVASATGQTSANVQFLSSLTSGTPNGTVHIREITLYGIGADPF